MLERTEQTDPSSVHTDIDMAAAWLEFAYLSTTSLPDSNKPKHAFTERGARIFMEVAEISQKQSQSSIVIAK